jgi:hypothetical protein
MFLPSFKIFSFSLPSSPTFSFFRFPFLQASKLDLFKCSLFTQINALEGFKIELNKLYTGASCNFLYFFPMSSLDLYKVPIPSGRTIALGFTQPLNRNEYQECSFGRGGGGARPARKVDDITAFCVSTV